jgi:serine/threonine protein kinase
VRRDRVAHYRFEGLLGAGGMGEVWSAFDEKLERRVAIKILPPERASDDARARMLREARAAGALRHPGIVAVHDTGEIDGLSYIVMEWVEGETVAARLERTGPVPPAEAVELVGQAADALGVAHEVGIVHRDVKAANLMIDPRGRVRVLDFGLSKRLPRGRTPLPMPVPVIEEDEAAQLDATIDPDAPTVAPTGDEGKVFTTDRTMPATPTPEARDPVTAFGARMGTPGYAAPELIAGAEADARSDVFSLAVVLYELIAGARPFQGGSWGELERAMKAGPAPLSEASNGAVGPAFDAAIARALAPRRADRYETIGQMMSVVRAAIAPAKPERRRGSWLVAGGAAAAIAGGAAIVMTSGGASPPAPVAPPPAPRPPAPPPGATELFAGAPRALTSLGGCAEGPIFADDRTVVFDLSRDSAVDLWAIGRDGSAPRRLTRGPGWHWRAAPGRTPGEVLYVLTDMDDESRSAVIAIDSATGAERARIERSGFSAAASGGAIYVAVKDGSEIRRRLGDRDEMWMNLPPDAAAYQLNMSSRGLLGFVTGAAGVPMRVCTAVPGAAPTCVARPLTTGRPEFSRDGGALYFDGADGIVRHDLASEKDRVVLPGAEAISGIGISPDGKSLAYSECREHTSLVDVANPAVAIVDDDHAMEPKFGPHGLLAWIHRDLTGNRLELRRADGSIVELVPKEFGHLTGVAFDADGGKIAFTAGGDRPGVYVVTVRPSSFSQPITQLTDGTTDSRPQFTRDGRVLFTRVDDRSVAHVFAVPVDSGPLTQTAPGSRQIRTSNPATGQVLVDVGEHTLWWDPISDRLSSPGRWPSSTRQIAVSPNGRWFLLQTGVAGLTIYRGRLDHPEALEKVADFPADLSLDDAAIDDDGRVIAPVSRWTGELKIIDAAPGVTL